MKNFITLMFFILSCNTIYSQSCQIDDCNPYLTAMGYTAVCTPQGQQMTLHLSWGINALSGVCIAPAGSWKIVIQFPSSGIYGVDNVSSVVGPKFDWTYDSVNKKLVGKTNTAVMFDVFSIPPILDNGLIDVTVTAFIQNGCSPVLSNTNIVFTPPWESGTCLAAFQNNTTDDALSASTAAAAPLPLELLEFNGKSQNCDHIVLDFVTTNEYNNDYMEILRSANGKNFYSIGKIKGSNNKFGENKYSFDDSNDLILGKKYYYKIKQVDLDGNFKFFETIVVRHHCQAMTPSLLLFPNPASELINVSFSGLEKDQKTDLIITNKLGTVVKKLNVDTEDISEIQINDLPSGIYKIQTTDFDDNLDYRFIHIK